VNGHERTQSGGFVRRLALAFALGLVVIAADSCFLIDQHILTVRNETQEQVVGLVARIKTQEVPIPSLEAGASTTVRMRINAEIHWEIYAARGDRRTLLGVCGYTGTTPGRPSENTLRIVPPSNDSGRDCVVSLG
jgi:hypothetical protein